MMAPAASSMKRPKRVLARSVLRLAAFVLPLIVSRLIAAETVWPEDERWRKATPESQGMSSRKLEVAARTAKTPIGDAIVIRHGREVWQYGDPYGRSDGWWASSAR